jgi:hypothetical protein
MNFLETDVPASTFLVYPNVLYSGRLGLSHNTTNANLNKTNYIDRVSNYSIAFWKMFSFNLSSNSNESGLLLGGYDDKHVDK